MLCFLRNVTLQHLLVITAIELGHKRHFNVNNSSFEVAAKILYEPQEHNCIILGILNSQITFFLTY